MKKILTTILSLLIFASLVSPAYAQTNISTCPTGQFQVLCNFQFNSIGNIVSSAITIILIIAVIISIFFLVLGGIRWITSGGDKTKVDEARKQIVAAIIGLIIAFLAFFIVRVAAGLLGLNLTNLNLPPINANPQ